MFDDLHHKLFFVAAVSKSVDALQIKIPNPLTYQKCLAMAHSLLSDDYTPCHWVGRAVLQSATKRSAACLHEMFCRFRGRLQKVSLCSNTQRATATVEAKTHLVPGAAKPWTSHGHSKPNLSAHATKSLKPKTIFPKPQVIGVGSFDHQF